MNNSALVAAKRASKLIPPEESRFRLPNLAIGAGCWCKPLGISVGSNCPPPLQSTIPGSRRRSSAMACALTRFGQHCRELRAQRGMTIGDQADALGAEPHEISAIETGKSPPPPHYSQRVSDWLGLNEQEKRELLKKIESNVVAFRHSTAGGERTTAMRLFRKISKMNPNEVRRFSKKPPPEAQE